MEFKIEIDYLNDLELYKIEIMCGVWRYSSAPQNIIETYQDIVANNYGICTKRIKSIFLCHEPVANISFKDNNEIEIFYYENINNKVCKKVVYSGVNIADYLSGFRDAMRYNVKCLGKDLEQIDNEVIREINSGLYEPFISKGDI